MINEIYNELTNIVGLEYVLIDEAMSKHTTFRIGGNCDYFVKPKNAMEIKEIIKVCKKHAMPYYVIGNGSNLLVKDGGFRGVIIQVYDRMNNITWEENDARVEAGALLSMVGKGAYERSLTGFEFATAIPGTMGGAVTMNAGAYGGEMADCIVSATLMNHDGIIKEYTKEELRLGYRSSVIITDNLIVLEAVIRLRAGDKKTIGNKLNELMNARKSKQPLEYPSAGSTFKRPEGYFAGKLIEDAGLKGYAHGGAKVSDKHSGFVINYNKATAKDVLELVKIVQDKIYEMNKVNIELEVKVIGED